jgi:DNA helicase-2/ATP-dependent DNA helicase PcrA
MEGGDAEIEEERRLMYVGITRARDLLTLTRARQRTMMGRTTMNPPSRFLDEIAADLVEPAESRGLRPVAVQNLRDAAEQFETGERVRHPRFGWGTVVAARGMGEDLEVTVEFPGGGVRSLLVRYAQLEREEA